MFQIIQGVVIHSVYLGRPPTYNDEERAESSSGRASCSDSQHCICGIMYAINSANDDKKRDVMAMTVG